MSDAPRPYTTEEFDTAKQHTLRRLRATVEALGVERAVSEKRLQMEVGLRLELESVTRERDEAKRQCNEYEQANHQLLDSTFELERERDEARQANARTLADYRTARDAWEVERAALKEHIRKGDHYIGSVERAEKAERERDEARVSVEALTAAVADASVERDKLLAERDEARAVLADSFEPCAHDGRRHRALADVEKISMERARVARLREALEAMMYDTTPLGYPSAAATKRARAALRESES